MNKKDFCGLMRCNAVTVVLLIQTFYNLPIALECLSIWSIISLLIHIGILRDYAKPTVALE